jgi:iron complex transport system permease protein
MRRALPWLLPILLLLAVLVALASGAVHVSLGDAARALAGTGDATTVSIIRSVRLPRVLLAALVGVALGISGGALQGTLRNALAEPYLLGVSGGAAVGAVIAVSLHVPGVAVAAFAGALAAVALVLLVARAAGTHGDPRALLMAGVVLGAFANAAILELLSAAPENAVRGALWWMMGSTGGAGIRDVAVLAVSVAIAGGVLLALAPRIDVLALGADAAASLGVDPERTARWIYIWASLLAAASVVAAGLIGFVGLVVPHIARLAIPGRHRPMLVLSGVAGALLVVLADLAARTVASPAELPLGAVTALLGVPFFLLQLRRAR